MLLLPHFLGSLAVVNAYVWPSPMLDALEAARWNQDGHNSALLATFIEPCNSDLVEGTNSGRADVADWVRTAYHDMATHNVADGTGGLDASIRFLEETSRPENPGTGFNNTLSEVRVVNDRYVSIADSLAVGTIIAIENCGGPEIPFRGGRIDAGEPNTPGVPEPQQDLDSHIAAFARQGFTQTEMIKLVACGHSFGGVEHAPFPDIVPEINDPNNTLSVAHFDMTFAHFDNNVATEYMSGTTQNPLVVGSNDTTNSDKRIFGSDGNVTMKSFADSPELFASTCADMFARMLDTVPRGVELTEVITPLPVKPHNLILRLAGDTLKLAGEVRFWNMTADAQRTVFMLLDDHAGGTGNVTLTSSGVSTAVSGRYSAAWYTFAPRPSNALTFLSFDAIAGIKSLRFVVDGKLEDQGGVGFAVQDGVVFSETSCYTSQHPPYKWRLDVAVRNGLDPSRVFLVQVGAEDSVERQVIVETDIPRPTQPIAANANYSIWSIEMADDNNYFVGAEVNGVKFSGNDASGAADLSPCAA
ncbi:heme peroxidase [Mycena olivaceomarginata]|nr:heme peroxidase [Mycena olivaceomarginata]